MTLEQIFKDKPELLEEPAVQVFVAQAKRVHANNVAVAENASNKLDKVLELCLHSEVFLKKGRASKEVVEDILELLND